MSLPEREPSDLAAKLSISTSRAIRPAMLGRFEFNLAAKLVVALLNPDPLQTFRHTLEAFQSLAPEEQALVEPDQGERTRHTMRYEIGTSLANMIPSHPDPAGRPCMIIPWSFAASSDPGTRGLTTPYFKLIGNMVWVGNDWGTIGELILKREPAAMDIYWDWLAGQTFLGNQPASVCLSLKTQFIEKNARAIQGLGRSITEKFIDPSVWQQALESVQGGKGGVKGGDPRVA